MLNKIILIGRLCNTPECRYTPNSVPVTGFTLAVDRRKVKDRDKETDFIEIVAWQALAETVCKHLDKGRMVAVDGRLQIRSYEDKEQIKRKKAEVIAENIKFLDYAKEKPKDLPGDEFSEDIPF